ncbi:TetR family transcriptional regulator [Alkalihalobacterium elongatum]|uniref:TetR family transcriptional regulator n=1 Tax=Alkalihalobacterium elongatum TaxID=2675466 RepID=UPI001C1F638C|nr:TetR family transcriptional regulator [Alkalihalobacterium elongatum]
MSPKVSEEYKEQKRVELLLAAKRVFETKGFEPATLADIIEEARISRGTIYLYFSSVEEIFEALLDYLEQQGQMNVEMYLQSFSTGWEAVNQFLILQKQAVLNVEKGIVPAFYEYSVISWRDMKKRERLSERYDKSKKLLNAIFNHGVNLGEFKPRKPIEEITIFILSLVNGLMLDTLNLGVNEEKVNQQMEMLEDLLKIMLGLEGSNEFIKPSE